MPDTDSSTQIDEREHDRERDPDRADRGDKNSKQKSQAASKAKDLSHVPCKFFKVGACTAGASCPFSHTLQEPGGQKETCAWFVKGNCKFGHKCALAHILPGQTMAMDRKNKKAAQVAAAATAGGSKDGKGGRGAKREAQSGNNGTNRNPLLAGGSTAPTRSLHPSSSSGRLPISMPLKATISPSAPAPPLKDTDFASFAGLDEAVQLPNAPAQGKSQQTPTQGPDSLTDVEKNDAQPKVTIDSASPPSPVHLPTSVPRTTTINNQAAHPDYGPIGSPPSTSQQQQHHVLSPPSRSNGTASINVTPSNNATKTATASSPLSHPQTALNGNTIHVGTPSSHTPTPFLSTSPFSAPGAQSVFLSYTPSDSGGASGMRGGVAASLGTGIAMGGGRRGWDGFGMSQGSNRTGRSVGASGRSNGDYNISLEYEEYTGVRAGSGSGGRGVGTGKPIGTAVDDEDLEDFLPSSLTDLLTPEERNRRMSRSNSGQGTSAAGDGGNRLGSGLGANLGVGTRGGAASGLGHRYSRSVPAPSLLGDIKSIWADSSTQPALPNSTTAAAAANIQFSGNALPSSPPAHGTPGSFSSSRFDTSLTAAGDEASGGSPSFSMLSPSNASAAFLPGLHHHYLNAKKQQQQQQLGMGLGAIGRGARNISSPLFSGSGSGSGNNTSGLGSATGSGRTVSNNYIGFTTGGTNTSTLSATAQPYRPPPSPFDLTQNALHNPNHPAHALVSAAANTNSTGITNSKTNSPAPTPNQSTRPIPSQHDSSPNNITSNDGQNNITNDHLSGPIVLSPSTRALQSHAPGQSLPQGLAAGYSRIHALPPLPYNASPVGASGFTGTSPGIQAAFGMGPYGVASTDWGHQNQQQQPLSQQYQQQHVSTSPNAHNNGMSGGLGAGLDSMFSRLSYSAATTRPNVSGTGTSPSASTAAVGTTTGGLGNHGAPPGLQRHVSGGRGQYSHSNSMGMSGAGVASTLSPLSGPVVTRDDDDDLFSMDG